MKIKIFENPLVFADFFTFPLSKTEQHEKAYALLYDMLEKYYNIKNADIIYDERGKPFFKDYNDIYLSISHCRNAVCAGIYSENIGVDIEKIKKHSPSVAKRIFTEQEMNCLENQCDNKKDEYFLRIWTLKESVIKLDGRGLAYGMNNINIDLENKKISPNLKFGQKIIGDFVISYTACQ